MKRKRIVVEYEWPDVGVQQRILDKFWVDIIDLGQKLTEIVPGSKISIRREDPKDDE